MHRRMGGKLQPLVLCIAIVTVLVLWASVSLASGPPEDGTSGCAQCHEDVRETYSKSVHAGKDFPASQPVACVSCHNAWDSGKTNLKEEYGTKSCAQCHGSIVSEWSKTKHVLPVSQGGAGLTCTSCHGDHNIKPVTKVESQLQGRCLSCHQQEANSVKATVHKSLVEGPKASCTQCHDAHSKTRQATEAKCQTCHDQAKKDYQTSAHLNARAADGQKVSCTTCHQAEVSHRQTPPAGPKLSAVREAGCKQCHPQAAAKLKVSAHQSTAGQSFTCTSCHSAHSTGQLSGASPVKIEVARVNLAQACQTCHDKAAADISKGPHALAKSSSGQSLQCQDCHGGHDIARIKSSQVALQEVRTSLNERCQTCHEAQKKDYLAGVHQNPVSLEGKPEASKPAASCIDCHSSHNPVTGAKVTDPAVKAQLRENLAQACSTCHQKAAADYLQSSHDKLSKEGAKAASCLDCHGSHRIQPVKSAGKPDVQKVAAINETCRNCHADQAKEFEKNTHAKVNQKTSAPNATCSACHSSHTIGKAPQGISSARPLAEAVNQACTSCHEKQGPAYQNSAHFKLDKTGNRAALCVDCHGAAVTSNDQRPKVTHDRIGVKQESTKPTTCTGCHDGFIARSYDYSFHGIAYRNGWKDAPSCADCHGSHEIRPSSDPLSLVSEKNRPQTCAKCHQYAAKNFARGQEHVLPQEKEENFPVWVVWKFYMALIVFTTLKDGPIVFLELVHRLRSGGHH